MLRSMLLSLVGGLEGCTAFAHALHKVAKLDTSGLSNAKISAGLKEALN